MMAIFHSNSILRRSHRCAWQKYIVLHAILVVNLLGAGGCGTLRLVNFVGKRDTSQIIENSHDTPIPYGSAMADLEYGIPALFSIYGAPIGILVLADLPIALAVDTLFLPRDLYRRYEWRVNERKKKASRISRQLETESPSNHFGDAHRDGNSERTQEKDLKGHNK